MYGVRRHLVLLGLTVCVARASAIELPTQEDTRLSLAARTALQEDFRFFYLNLGVPVRSGVATVWGPVPSADTEQQILDRVAKVRGIKRVRNEMIVLPEDEWPDAWRNVQPLLRPIGQKPRPGEQIAISLRPPMLLDDITPAPPAPLVPRVSDVSPKRERGADPFPPPLPARPKVDAPMPTSLRDPYSPSAQLAAQAHPEDLRSAIDNIQKTDVRFAGITVVLDNGIVYLRGQGSILFTLGERVSVLPGVERVIVQMPPR
jgi:osmotically-inducible protein OsmY